MILDLPVELKILVSDDEDHVEASAASACRAQLQQLATISCQTRSTSQAGLAASTRQLRSYRLRRDAAGASWPVLCRWSRWYGCGGDYADNFCMRCKKVLFRRINGVNETSKRPRREVLGGAKRWLCVHGSDQSGLCAKRQTLVVKEVVTSLKVPVFALSNRNE
jgi:hypothetical protein